MLMVTTIADATENVDVALDNDMENGNRLSGSVHCAVLLILAHGVR